MNNYSPVASGSNTADAADIRAFLQQAVDHYPRLATFSFTLKLPYREAMNEYRSLILRFHTEVWQRTGGYSRQRQQERRHSPPTVLRWMWEAASAPECKMVLMMNLDTLGAISNVQLIESAQQVISEIIREAWQAVTDAEHHDVMNMTPIIINRSGRGTHTMPFNQLRAQVQMMPPPVATARTGVAG